MASCALKRFETAIGRVLTGQIAQGYGLGCCFSKSRAARVKAAADVSYECDPILRSSKCRRPAIDLKAT
jgi:hypothetical protein